MSSPLNIGVLGMGGLGLAKNLAKGFVNRKEYGGGIKGLAKATGAQMSGEHEDNKLDSINEKLDTLVGAMDEESQDVNQDPSLVPPAPFAPATPLNFKEFMTSTVQDPSTNGTGSARPNFSDTRPMSVADPEINTKGSLFNKQ
ncbi:MAG: hypothetical protein GY810_18605 [Aureispira sp.]|nr:hypothetical protein [Aureispira sp.]